MKGWCQSAKPLRLSRKSRSLQNCRPRWMNKFSECATPLLEEESNALRSSSAAPEKVHRVAQSHLYQNQFYHCRQPPAKQSIFSLGMKRQACNPNQGQPLNQRYPLSDFCPKSLKRKIDEVFTKLNRRLVLKSAVLPKMDF